MAYAIIKDTHLLRKLLIKFQNGDAVNAPYSGILGGWGAGAARGPTVSEINKF